LQHFVRGLQRSAYVIEGRIRQISTPLIERFFEEVMEDERRRPRMEEGYTADELIANLTQGWSNVKRWFIGSEQELSELALLERATKETIAKIVRSALRLQESKRVGLSRRKDLETLGSWFARLERVEEGHMLAAYSFGLFESRHYQGEDERSTDRADISMWQEPPSIRAMRTRSRKRTEKSGIEPVRRADDQKKEYREQVARQLAEESIFLDKMAERGSVTMSSLGVLEAKERLQLLQWIGRCTANASGRFVASDGTRISITPSKNRSEALLRCVDGEMSLPDYELTFRKEAIISV
jgi:uncharacterized protein (TIGR02677 family)